MLVYSWLTIFNTLYNRLGSFIPVKNGHFFIVASSSKTRTAVFLLIFFLTNPGTTYAQKLLRHETPTRQFVHWTHLTFQGSRFSTDIKVHIALDAIHKVSDNTSRREIGLESDQCPSPPDDYMLLTVSLAARGVFFGESQYEEKILFDDVSFHPYQRVRLSNGKEKWLKTYCWEQTGVRRHHIQPEDSSEDQEPSDKWTARSTSFYEYPIEVGKCKTISDPSLLLYILSDRSLDRPQEDVNICMFGKKQLHRITIRQIESSPLFVAYRNHSIADKTAIKEQLVPLVFSITSETFAPPGKKPESFSLLGLNTDIHIAIDPTKHLPLRVTGISSIGKLTLDLSDYIE